MESKNTDVILGDKRVLVHHRSATEKMTAILYYELPVEPGPLKPAFFDSNAKCSVSQQTSILDVSGQSEFYVTDLGGSGDCLIRSLSYQLQFGFGEFLDVKSTYDRILRKIKKEQGYYLTEREIPTLACWMNSNIIVYTFGSPEQPAGMIKDEFKVENAHRTLTVFLTRLHYVSVDELDFSRAEVIRETEYTNSMSSELIETTRNGSFLYDPRSSVSKRSEYFQADTDKVKTKFELEIDDEESKSFRIFVTLEGFHDHFREKGWPLSVPEKFHFEVHSGSESQLSSDLYKINHELISLVMNGTMFGTDKSMKFTRKTPDEWIETDDQVRVLDYKGTGFKAKEDVYLVYQGAIKKYEDECYKYANWVGKELVVHSIVMANRLVVSSLPLSEDEAFSLFVMDRLGSAIDSYIASLGHVRSENDSLKLKLYKESLEGASFEMKEKTKTKGHLTDEMIQSFKEPIDEEFLHNEEIDLMQESETESQGHIYRNRMKKEWKESRQEYLNKMNEVNNLERFPESVLGKYSTDKTYKRGSNKRIVSMPFFPMIPNKNFREDDYVGEILAEFMMENHGIAEIVKQAITNYLGNSHSHSEKRRAEMKKQALTDEGYTNERKSKNYEAKIRLPQSSHIGMNLFLKRDKDHVENKWHYNRSRSLCSYEGLDDITEWVNSNHYHENSGHQSDITMKRIDPLLSFDDNDCKLGVEPALLYDQYQRTKIGLATAFYSSLAMELNISTAQSRPGKYVVKQIPFYDAYLIIRFTNTSRNFQFVLLARKDKSQLFDNSSSKLFAKPCVVTENWIAFQFCTVDRHRISHMLTTHQMGFSLLCMYMELFKSPLKDMKNWTFSKDVSAHALFSLLVFLEDKQQTSGDLMQARFAYMSCLSAERRPHFKIHSKLDFRSKSRLLSWYHKRLYTSLLMMSKKVPEPLVGENGSRKGLELNYDGLISFVTLKKIDTIEIAINISYLGVLHNRDEGDETHGNQKILVKLIGVDLKRTQARMLNMGYRQNVKRKEMRKLETSPVWMKAFARAKLEELKRQYGDDYMSRHRVRIARTISNRTIAYLATFKSSSIPEDGDSSLPENKRTKVINALMQWVKGELEFTKGISLDSKPLYFIRSLVEYLSLRKNSGIYTSIFKKLQIGGPREIFILDVVSRIVVHWLETHCRLVCEDSANEMLTNPNKHEISRSHMASVLARSRARDPVIHNTSIDSADASKWAQSFIMPTFACFVVNFFPEEESRIMTKILDLVSHKVICLPSSLVKSFKEKRDVRSREPAINELKDQYLGESDEETRILDAKGYLMRNVSNMMQGILHYLSSLIHSAKQDKSKELCERLVRAYSMNTFGTPDAITILITHKISSDDSSTVRTTFLRKSALAELSSERVKEIKRDVMMLHRASSKIEEKLYVVFGATLSEEKSTMCVFTDVEEFNSVWVIQDNQIMPKLKFVMPALRMTISSSLVQRQIVFSNLRRQLKASGASSWMCSVIQFCQKQIHYESLGAKSVELFDDYVRLMIDCPHPIFGLFVDEPSIVCGIFGYDLAEYLLLKREERSRLVFEWMHTQKDLDITDDGKRTLNIELLMGDRKRYKEALNQMGIPQDWRDHVITDEKFEMMLVGPETIEDMQFFMRKKYTSPGASDSFTFNMHSKMNASASYIFQSPCITLSEKIMQEDGTRGWSRKKRTLLRVLMYYKENRPRKAEMKISDHYDHHHLYDRVMREVRNARSLLKSPERSRPRRKVKLYFSVESLNTPISMKESVLFRWFGLSSRYSHSEYERAWGIHSYKYPWLRHSLSETLEQEDCPYSDRLGLADFVVSLDVRSKMVEAVSPTYNLGSNGLMLSSIITEDYLAGHKVSLDLPEDDLDVVSNLNQRLMLEMTGFSNDEKKLNRIERMLRSSADTFDKMTQPELDMMTDRQLSTVLCSLVAKHGRTSDPTKRYSILRLLSRLRRVLGHFSKAQKFRDGQWTGEGQFVGQIDGRDFVIRSHDSLVKVIKVRSQSDLVSIKEPLQEFLRKIGWQWDDMAEGRGVLRINRRGLSVTNGTKVLITPDLGRLDLSLINEDLDLVMRHNHIEVLVRYKRSVPVFKYFPRLQAMPVGTNDQSYGSVSKIHETVWMTMSVASLEKLSSFIRAATNKLNMSDQELNSLLDQMTSDEEINQYWDKSGKANRVNPQVKNFLEFVFWLKKIIVEKHTRQKGRVFFSEVIEKKDEEEKPASDYNFDFLNDVEDLFGIEDMSNANFFLTEEESDVSAFVDAMLEINENSSAVFHTETKRTDKDILEESHPFLNELDSRRMTELDEHLEGRLEHPLELIKIIFPFVKSAVREVVLDDDFLI